MASGFLTPASLHYVRNHGAVPVAYASAAEADAVYDGWRCEVLGGGGVAAKSLSMADLEKFPKVVVPSLLVCAGNRRKEQNMIKRSIGFNWGAAGLGMSEPAPRGRDDFREISAGKTTNNRDRHAW